MIPKKKIIYYKQTQQVGQSQVSIAFFTAMRRTEYFTNRHKLHLFEEYSPINHMPCNVTNRKHSCIYQRIIDSS